MLMIIVSGFTFGLVGLTTSTADDTNKSMLTFDNYELTQKGNLYGDFMNDLYSMFMNKKVDFNKLPKDSIQKYLNEFSNMFPKGSPFSTIDTISISSKFGWRKNPNTHKPQYHTGVDISMPIHTKINSTMSGEVVVVKYTTKATYGQGYGNYIVIKNSIGFQTLYSHLSGIYVREGQRVEKGQLIATVGITGNATGPNLHYEIYQAGELKNPLDSLFTNYNYIIANK